ncbi:amino acid permease [Psychrobacillus sp. NEAU-3TGS]|uniref:APC family permease n=1 Tax=Psychrobacillus sp. NEAU-3TGS TaxID=2995412 RepID=UPI00249747AC|nr:amino acid permease [Psychrobacillus sp. NEAU-3TGS]MDI2589341.1 amino acid permease [Psychrobacillus sp. NEAU-3TGS]
MKDKGMSTKDFFGLAFGSMIGIGWVISIPAWMSTAGSVGAIIAVALTMCMIIPIGFVYGELTASLKVSGGEFAYTFKALGKLPAFICGWFLILGYLIILPWVAISISLLASYVFPALNSIPLYTVFTYQVYLPQLIVSLIVVGTIVYMNWKGTKQSTIFQNTATLMMILTFIVFIVGGIFIGDANNISPLFASKGEVSSIVLAMSAILFFMNGFDTIPKTVDEAKSKINYSNLGKAIVGTILLGGVLYILIIIASSFIMPANQIGGLGTLPLINALEVTTGSKILPYIVSFGALMGVITTFNGFLLAGSRLISSFSKAGFLPDIFSKSHPKYKTPHVTLLFMTIVTILGILLGSGVLLPFIIMGGISFLIAWFCMALSSVKLRKTHPNMDRPYKIPGGTRMAYIATLFSGLFLVLMIIPGTPISMGKIEYILFISWMFLGVLLYTFRQKKEVVLHTTIIRKEDGAIE